MWTSEYSKLDFEYINIVKIYCLKILKYFLKLYMKIFNKFNECVMVFRNNKNCD